MRKKHRKLPSPDSVRLRILDKNKKELGWIERTEGYWPVYSVRVHAATVSTEDLRVIANVIEQDHKETRSYGDALVRSILAEEKAA